MLENLKGVQQNNEWKYLLRVLIIIGIVILVVYKLWFSWWIPSNASSTEETQQTQKVVDEEAEKVEGFEHVKINDNTIVIKETMDVMNCSGAIKPENCKHTQYNCNNIGGFELWLAPEKNIERCQKLESPSRFDNPVQIPECIAPQRLYFVPSSKSYFCK